MSEVADTASGQTPTDTAPAAAAPAPAPAPAPAGASLLAYAPAAGADQGAAAPADPPAGEKPTPTAEEAQAAADALAKAEADAKANSAPEQYEDFKAPDGIKFDADVTTEFKDLAKALNLPQEKAQQVMDLAAKHQQKVDAQRAEAETALVQVWVQATISDKEIGGDKLQENLAVSRKAVEAFGTPELKELLNGPMGNHPEVARLLFRVGNAISEDRLVGGKPGSTAEQSTAQRMYPNMNP